MVGSARSRLVPAAIAALIAGGAGGLSAQPQVVATAEGQIGKTPPSPLFDRVHPPGFAPVTVPGSPMIVPDLALALIFQPGGFMPPPPELTVLGDRFHLGFAAVELDAVPSDFAQADKVAPAVEPWPGYDDTVAVTLGVDGSESGTMTVRILTYDLGGGVKTLDLEVPDVPNNPLFPSPDLYETGVAVDDQGRGTTVFTEVPGGSDPPRVKAQTWDGLAGGLTDLVEVSPDGIDPEVALLQPDGERLVVTTVDVTDADAGTIQGNFLDLSGPAPVALPEFPVNTTAAPFGNFRPAVAADPLTGAFTVCWDFVTGLSDPSDIRARRYDPEGLPEDDDFQVNVPPLFGEDGSQGQCDVAYGPGRLSVIVWAADGTTGDPDTDIYARAFLPDGTPILNPMLPLLAGQFRVNSGNTPGGPLSDRQDQPKVSFLPQPDLSGRPQFAVVWRDVGDGSGAAPNGTGTSTRCYSLDGLEEAQIFADGFESGDTASWSSSTP